MANNKTKNKNLLVVHPPFLLPHKAKKNPQDCISKMVTFIFLGSLELLRSRVLLCTLLRSKLTVKNGIQKHL